MAVVPMTKLRVVGLKSESAKIMETLSRSRCFETREADFPLPRPDNTDTINAIAAKQSKAGYAIEYLNKQADILGGMKNAADAYGIENFKQSSAMQHIAADEFFGIVNEEKELLEVIAEIDAISFRQNDIKQELTKLKDEAVFYQPYYCCPHPFSIIGETKKTAIMLFSAPKSAKTLNAAKDSWQNESVFYAEYFSDAKYKAAAAVCLLSQREEMINFFHGQGFSPCAISGDFTAADYLEELNQKQAALKNESEQLFKKALLLLPKLFRLKILYDYYSVVAEQYGDKSIAEGSYVMLVEGWCPSDAAEKLCGEIKNNTTCAYFDVKPPEDGETVPTLLKNSAVVTPFEDMTEMYTVPDYRESDPNKFMAFWYFFIFGLMCGDAVYGVLLTAACLIMLKIKKPEKGMANILKLFAVCGVSTAIWGVIFGSFAGFGIPVSNNFAFGYNSGGVRYFGWFNSMEKPIMLFGLSLIVGIAHLIFGYGLKCAENLKNKHPFDAICEGIFPALILLSLYFLGANIFYGIFTRGEISLSGQFLPSGVSGITGSAGMVMILIGIAGIVLTAGRGSLANKKAGIAGRIGGWLGSGLNGLYGLINMVSDILSYSRVFGLGLSGAAIAYAFNTLVDVVFFGGNIVMIGVGVLLLGVLHIFNLGIGLLGTYVHNARLQFLEFYGKFLNGEGKSFAPLGQNTKYIKY